MTVPKSELFEYLVRSISLWRTAITLTQPRLVPLHVARLITYARHLNTYIKIYSDRWNDIKPAVYVASLEQILSVFFVMYFAQKDIVIVGCIITGDKADLHE
jgi:hypothetical protein